MQDKRRRNDKQNTNLKNTNNPPQKSRNIERLQEKQLKRGRFTQYS
jgi:hypothetical protein